MDPLLDLPAAPDGYEGPISEFVDRFVMPSVPNSDRLVSWSDALLSYYSSPDPICIVRGRRRGELRVVDDERVVDSDNAPGIWCFLRALDGTFNPAGLRTAIDLGEIPVFKIIRRNDRPAWNYSRGALSASDSSILWKRKLKHCHILGLDVKSGLTARQRALRNLNPANHFLFPNGNRHFATDRIGWEEEPSPSDLGESRRVMRWVAWRIRERLDTAGVCILDNFVIAAGSRPPVSPPSDGGIRVRLQDQLGNGGLVRKGKEGPGIYKNPSEDLAVPLPLPVRRWTMNAALDAYVRTHEPETRILLSLSYRRLDSSVEFVGNFVLDLVRLTEAGVCARRDNVFQVRIVRNDGEFLVDSG